MYMQRTKACWGADKRSLDEDFSARTKIPGPDRFIWPHSGDFGPAGQKSPADQNPCDRPTQLRKRPGYSLLSPRALSLNLRRLSVRAVAEISMR